MLATKNGGEGRLAIYSPSDLKFFRVLLLLTPQYIDRELQCLEHQLEDLLHPRYKVARTLWKTRVEGAVPLRAVGETKQPQKF